MAMVHQNLSLVPEMTIWENIALGREQTGALSLPGQPPAPSSRRRGPCRAIRVELPSHERVKNISPDEKQLVEIAKAMAKDPRILILDEPTASLDFHQVEALFAAVRGAEGARGVHRVHLPQDLGGREDLRQAGRLPQRRDGRRARLLRAGARRPADRAPDHGAGGLASGSSGPARRGRGRSRGLAAKGPVLEMRDVSLDRARLSHVSLALRRGEILGLGGLQGQGQEEILMILAGYLRGYTGKILVNGRQPCPCATRGRPSGRASPSSPGTGRRKGCSWTTRSFPTSCTPRCPCTAAPSSSPAGASGKRPGRPSTRCRSCPPDPG